MSVWRDSALLAYRRLSQPLRWWQGRRWQAGGQYPIVVLFYHRVADHRLTDWTMTREDFRAQVDWLQRHFELLSMDQVHERLRLGRNSRPAVAITFDDGYADNMDFALPFLAERRIPCMYYVATEFVLNQGRFPHDQALGLDLAPNSVRDLKRLLRWGIDIGSHTRTHLDLGAIYDRRELEYELAGSRRDLMNLLGTPIRHFAFPFGQRVNISKAAVQAATRAGYETVCGAYGGYNWMGQDASFIQRVHGDPHLARVQNWVTLDPRWWGVRPTAEWLIAECEPDEGSTVPVPVGRTAPATAALAAYQKNAEQALLKTATAPVTTADPLGSSGLGGSEPVGTIAALPSVWSEPDSPSLSGISPCSER